ncbi:hypothetical protein N7468_007773 [Penicillium chermesinum]|uniref:Azaphilone pigments biosynthesis cluster protein L N-terminal domain-containing protein n=1 Tax=Penicillium chermesinum TaxID=63820 RepID=A0A9W9NNG8_9EURO|nr:uncharacterized protein N7468_007773 [Penicillium chermesinum]KAJ5223231.1 hypothetical protein N7468_007773 [Penicillium chermesinum]
MAEAIGVASGIVALATFAFQSSVSLYKTVESFRSHPKRVRDLLIELDALSAVLAHLVELVQSNPDVNLSLLNLPLLRCGDICKGFQQELMKYAARSTSNHTSFRDWAKLMYKGENIDDVRNSLASYKATINIALTDTNLRLSAAAVGNMEEYQNLIQEAKEDLGARLESIDSKLEDLARKDEDQSGSDSAELRSLRDERLSTENCLQICAQLSSHIDQIQLMSKKAGASRGPSGSDNSPESVTNEGLQECKNSLAATAAKLEQHMREVMDRLLSKSKAGSSRDDVQDLSRLRDEWEAARQCLDICSRADSNLKENVSIIENYGTGDALQFMVSANGKVLHGKNQGLGWRSRQVGGYMSDESIQQLSRDLSVIYTSPQKPGVSTPQGASVPGEETTAEFKKRYGRGFTLSPTRMPNTPAPPRSSSN